MANSISSAAAEHNHLGDWSDDATGQLIDSLCQHAERMSEVERTFSDRIETVADHRKASARNLLQYVSLRQQDLRLLQEELCCRGLSSLGRCEANVQATVSRVIDILCRLSGQASEKNNAPIEVDFARSRQLMDRSTRDLFGPRSSTGAAHIMVTMPSEAALDRSLVSDLIEHGMDCMRINCALMTQLPGRR